MADADIMLQDILEQPEALEQALDALTAEGAPARAAELARGAVRLVFTGMGASYFACYPALLRLWQAGRPAVWVETGELLHFAPALAGPDHLLVTVSQSGRTAEVVHLLARLPAGCRVVAVTNDPRSPLGQAAAAVLPLHAGIERAVCSTKTYTCSLLALDLLVDALLGEAGAPGRWTAAIDATAQALFRRDQWLPGLTELLGVPEHLWLLARGPAVSAACCGALIIKESSRVHAEGMSAPQFRHGPLEAAGAGRAALVLTSPGALGRLDLDLAGEMAATGMTVAAVSLGHPPAPPASVATVQLPAVPVGLEPVLQVLPAQLLGRALALAQGRAPGQLHLIGKVTLRE